MFLYEDGEGGGRGKEREDQDDLRSKYPWEKNECILKALEDLCVDENIPVGAKYNPLNRISLCKGCHLS